MTFFRLDARRVTPANPADRLLSGHGTEQWPDTVDTDIGSADALGDGQVEPRSCAPPNAAAPRRRRWPLIVVAPLYSVLVVVFFSVGWWIFFWPSSGTVKILALLALVPLFLFVAAVLLAKWII